MVLEWIANPSTLERGFLSSSLSRSAKLCISSVMAASRSPKPSVKVRVLGGTPVFRLRSANSKIQLLIEK